MSNATDDDAHLAGLAGLYALDALDDVDRQRFEELLARDPELAEEVAGFRAAAARLADVTATAPPASLRDRVLAEVAATRQDAPVVDLAARRRRGRTRTWAVAAAVVAVVGAGFGGYALRGDGGGDAAPIARSELSQVLDAADAEVVPLVSTGSGAPEGRVVISRSSGRLAVVTDGLPVPAPGRTYELWRLDRTGGVRSAGTFEPGPDGRVREVLDLDASGAAGFAVTDEPDGGSPGPTTPVLLQAQLS